MTWDSVQGVLNLRFDPMFTSAIAATMFALGLALRKRFAFLRTFCVPAGVVGGLCMAGVIFLLHLPDVVSVHFDQALQGPLIAIFFTRVGLTGSFRLFKRGGKVMFYYLLFCWGLAVFQNVLGVALAHLFGIHPVLGVMAGAVSLEGGHNLAVVFGPYAEELGVAGAQIVAVSAATFGLIAGGVFGAAVAEWLIKHRELALEASEDVLYRGYHDYADNENVEVNLNDFVRALGLILVVMALGSWGADRIQEVIRMRWPKSAFTLPGYLGSMFLAVLFRNLNDWLRIVRIHPKSMDLISAAAVSLFLTTSMMGLKIGELYGLALPLLLLLVVQTAAIVLIAVYLLFPLMGGDYDAAIICSGFVGHGLGAPPSAVSMMRAACEQHDLMSYKAFLIVPLCGAVLIDLVALPNIIWFINYFSR